MPITVGPKAHTALPQAEVKPAGSNDLNCSPSCGPCRTWTTETEGLSVLNHLSASYDNELDDTSYSPQASSYITSHIDLTVNSLVDHLCR